MTDNRPVWIVETVFSCDSKVTQNFGKKMHKLDHLKYGMAGNTEVSLTKSLMYPFVLYLCFHYICYLT